MEEESGITFGEICHLVKKRIWWILGISVIVALVASLLFGFVINRGKNDYSVTFMVEFPGVSDRQYPDGTTFNHASMVYAAQLEAAKASDEAFADIDVEGMSSNGGISISAETTTGANNTTVYTGVYTITVSSAYFESADQASDFLRAVLDQTIATVNAKISGMDFTAGLSGYDSLTTYEDRLNALKAQQTYLLARYAAVTGDTQNDSDTTTQTQTQTTATYGSFQYEGKSISALYAEAQAASSTLALLESEYAANRYVLIDGKSDEELQNMANSWAQQIKSNQDRLDAFNQNLKDIIGTSGTASGSIVIDTTYMERIQELTETIADLKAQLTAIGYTDNGNGTAAKSGEPLEANTTFGQEVDALFDTVKANSERAKSALVALFAAESQIVYQQSGVTTIVNATNIILVAVAALVVAFLIACIVFCAADYPAYKRERDAKRTAAVAAPEEAAEPESKEE